MSDNPTPIFEVGTPSHRTQILSPALAKKVADQNGEWVAILSYPEGKENHAAQTVWRIRHNRAAAWRNVGSFDACCRKQDDGTTKVWARAV